MGLSGNLESFGVLEILQLMALQRKSGVLRLANERGEQQMLFLEKGRIVSTRDRRSGGEDPLLKFLRAANYLTDDQLKTLSRVQSESNRDTLYVMLSSGMIGRDRLVEAVTQHTQQIVDNLLGWNHGTYEFTGDERSLPKLALKVPLSVEQLLMEGMRRMDELATIKQAVLAPDLHLLRSSDPVNRSALSRELQVVLDLVKGSTSVEFLVGNSPLGEYSTYEAISALLETGLLVVDPCPPVRASEPAAIPLVRLPAQPRVHGRLWALLGGAGAGSLVLALALSPLLHGGATGLLPPEVEKARRHADVMLAREVYRATNGTAPTVETLVEEGYLRKSAADSER